MQDVFILRELPPWEQLGLLARPSLHAISVSKWRGITEFFLLGHTFSRSHRPSLWCFYL